MIKGKTLITLTSLIFMLSCESAKVDKTYNQGINITPAPLELTEKGGYFLFNKQLIFISPNEDVDRVASYFGDRIKRSTGYQIDIKRNKPRDNYINLIIDPTIDVNDEGYLFNSTQVAIEIKAKTSQGIFYALQTLMQLLPAEIESTHRINYIEWKIPLVEIKDEPRFKYRGMHLDVCRHFVSVDFIKKQLDVLALFKINRFHWHLTEDQGWRIEIKKYPELTSISSKRIDGEGTQYGPYFYTQEQIKEIVAYAKERFIEVIPEIELPGHAVAVLAAYPQYSCTGGPFEVRHVWGVSDDIFCAGNDSTFSFIEDVIAEVAPLFESEYFHIGGDEAPKVRWEKCPKCQARIAELGIKGDAEHLPEEQLQSYFIKRVEKMLLAHGKKMIGWDEILEGGLAPSATVMSWRGEKGGIAAANMGHDVIMTPGEWLYFDHYQCDPKVYPVAFGGYTPLSKTYGYNPVPQELAQSKHHYIQGVQANIWTEYMYNEDQVENRIYPRILALSEIAWSALAKKDYPDFLRRLDNQRVRLDMHDINYYIPIAEQDSVPSCDFIAFTHDATLKFKTTEPVKIVYTTDGSEPVMESAEYKDSLLFEVNTTLKLRSILASGKMGDIRTITLERQKYAPATEKTNVVNKGLKAEYYKGLARKVSDIDQSNPIETEYVSVPENIKYQVHRYDEPTQDDYYSTVLTGYINIPENDVYYFSSLADEVWIDDKLLISNEGEVKRNARNDKSIALAKGYHKIKMVRLSATFGGMPPLWYGASISIRASGDKDFEVMDESYFK